MQDARGRFLVHRDSRARLLISSGRLYGAGSTVIHKPAPAESANTTARVVKGREGIRKALKTVRASRTRMIYGLEFFYLLDYVTKWALVIKERIMADAKKSKAQF